MMEADEDIIKAHRHCIHHKAEIQKSKLCGCFFCLAIFTPDKIKEWCGWPVDTAVCPYCPSDSVIGDASGFPITKEFLQRMKEYWFEGVKVEGFEYKVSRHILD